MKNLLQLGIIAFFYIQAISANAQCAEVSAVHAFTYDGRSYEIIKDNKSWIMAAACAVERGGYLAEINSAEEQDAIFAEISTAQINPDDTEAPDGFSSYVWLGGNDIVQEGKWIWDGNNDASSTQFWQGTFSGTAIGGLYNNWGDEPDNSAGGTGQDGLGLAIIDWPLGEAGQWNDIKHENELYYIVEYDNLMGTNKFEQHSVDVYPNPADSHVFVNTDSDVEKLVVINTIGQEVKSIVSIVKDSVISLDGLARGTYFIKLHFQDGRQTIKKIIKQ